LSESLALGYDIVCWSFVLCESQDEILYQLPLSKVSWCALNLKQNMHYQKAIHQ